MSVVRNYRVHAITIATRHPEELAAFYQQALNVSVAKQVDKDHLGIQLENLYLGFDRSNEETKGGGPVIWLYVENVEEMFVQVVEAGGRVRTNVDRSERPGQALAVFYDPDGNMFGLIGPSVPGGKL